MAKIFPDGYPTYGLWKKEGEGNLEELQAPTTAQLETALYDFQRLGKNTGEIEVILISYEASAKLEREIWERVREYGSTSLGDGRTYKGIPLARHEAYAPMFIFVLKRRASAFADITMSIEEYNLRSETMRISFNTAMNYAEEKVKEPTSPPTKTPANIRKRKLRWD